MNERVVSIEGDEHMQTQLLLPWLVNETLDGDELAMVKRHLEGCISCQSEHTWLHSLQAACTSEQPAAGTSAARSQRRLRRRLSTERTGRPHRRFSGSWRTWVIAAQAVLIVTAAATLIVRSKLPTSASYHTLSASQPARARLVVMFSPTLTEGRMRQLMRATDARIIDGPIDNGAYIISVPSAQASVATQMLRAARDVTLVVSLGPDDVR